MTVGERGLHKSDLGTAPYGHQAVGHGPKEYTIRTRWRVRKGVRQTGCREVRGPVGYRKRTRAKLNGVARSVTGLLLRGLGLMTAEPGRGRCLSSEVRRSLFAL